MVKRPRTQADIGRRRASRFYKDSPAPRDIANVASGAGLKDGAFQSRHFPLRNNQRSIPSGTSVLNDNIPARTLTGDRIGVNQITGTEIGPNAVGTTQIGDSTITSNFESSAGATVRSHLSADTVGRRELLSHATNNNLRAVGRDHIRNSAINGDKVEDESLPGAKITGLHGSKIGERSLPGGKLQSNTVGYIEITNAITGGTDPGPPQSNKGLRRIAGDGVSLSAAASDHKHGGSVGFEYLPKETRMKILECRKRLSARKGIWEIEDIEDLVADLLFATLALLHMKVDHPDETGDEKEIRRANDPDVEWETDVKPRIHDGHEHPKGKYELYPHPDLRD